MGILVSAERAKTGVCTCYKIDPAGPETPENMMCWVSGIIGTCSDLQDRLYCKRRIVKTLSPEFSARLNLFKEWGRIADRCFEGSVADPWGCVVEEVQRMRGDWK